MTETPFTRLDQSPRKAGEGGKRTGLDYSGKTLCLLSTHVIKLLTETANGGGAFGGNDARAARGRAAIETGRWIERLLQGRTSGHLPGRRALWSREPTVPVGVSGNRDRCSGPAGGMFRGLSSWFGLEQPAAGGRQSEGDGQVEGDASPQQCSEAVSESAAEGEPRQAGDQELLHQAKGLGSESPPALGTRECGGCLLPSLEAPELGPDRLRGVGVEGEEGVSVTRSSWDGRGW